MKTLWNRLENTQGQVSIFIALIFQVLFLFFAMIVNVGLLVHHKINLQNSVDLAAYYGAMKQAESLNAIAHLNYQIRQDWKLLAWRYRVLGGAGQDSPPILPYDKNTGLAVNAKEDAPLPTDDALKLFQKPALCMDYVPFLEVKGGQNTCKDMIKYSAIKIFGVPPATSLIAISNAIQAATAAAISTIEADCKGSGPMNWILAARFKVAYLRDQGERKKAINLIANSLSGYSIGDTTDFRELDGTKAKEGIRKTLVKNLTLPNSDSLSDFEIYNGLGDPSCNAKGGTMAIPPKWLSEIPIVPAFATVTTNCPINKQTGGEYQKSVINVETCDGAVASGYPNSNVETNGVPLCPRYATGNVLNELKQLAGMVNYQTPPYSASIGFEKNPWCMAYVGVKASTKPKIPFMPFGAVTMTAKSFAKPFGGRIGPWFSDTWQAGLDASSGKKTDALLPNRYTGTIDLTDENRFPNYSKYPGDKFGLMSRAVLFAYERLLYEISGRPPRTNRITLATKILPTLDVASDVSPSFNDWLKIATDYTPSNNPEKDILAWNNTTKKPTQMRVMELSAIAPDLFDTTYYSIEPNFFDNYYNKIMTLKSNLSASQLDLPSDLGARDDTTSGLQNFSVKQQILLQQELAGKIDSLNNLYAQIRDPDHVLTSWAPDNMLNYDTDPGKFGKCSSKDFRPVPGVPVPGDCISGGRTGFSVKLVSGDYLRRSDLQLGGPVGGGPLRNPPPPSF